MSHRFCRYQLRTTNVAAAKAFYTAVFGAQHWSADVVVTQLPPQAAAMGAPAHWLGWIGVEDVEGTVKKNTALGGQQLGPMHEGPDGIMHAPIRDPFGAALALTPIASPESVQARVAAHVLHAKDDEKAMDFYVSLFGWTHVGVVELNEGVRHQMFAWDESGRITGSIANTAQQPNVHAHWAYCFEVDDIDAALARIHAHGGNALPKTKTPRGDWVAACEDVQRAAFAIFRVARAK